MTVRVRSVAFLVPMVVVVLLVLTYPTVRGDEPPVTREAVCRWADQAPTIDGKLDEPAWKTAAVIDRFPSFWKEAHPGPAHATKARLLWDRDALYYAAEMTDADDPRLRHPAQ